MISLESINETLPLIKFAVIFAAVVFTIARKWDLALVLGGGALAMGLLFGMNPAALGLSVLRGIIDLKTILLVGMVYGIMVFSVALRETGHLQKFIHSTQQIVPSFRLRTAAVPALVGLLPMPGGAIFSAPLLEEMAEGSGISPERETFINPWFRHVWEYILPLYPGVLMAAAMWDIPVRTVITYNAPLTPFSIIAGFIVVSFGLKAIRKPREPLNRGLFIELLKGIWPFVLLITAALVLPFEMVIIVWAIILLFFIIDRVKPKKIWAVFKAGFRWKILLMIIAVMVFKHVMEDSGAAEQIAHSLLGLNLPVGFIFFALPFLVGILGGLTIAYVGISFPILIPLLGSLNGDAYGAMMLAYAGGFIGVLLSPIHLCLILTNEYFGSSLLKTYYYFIPAAAIVTALTWGYYYLLVWI
ncbi:MAG: DUF401 family protein [bacterium]|nr:DUF401 family protein [bacterium]